METAFAYRPRPVKKDPEPEPHREYSSTQIQITGRPAEIMRKMAGRISPADLGTDGVEHEQHVTVKWGLHFQTPTKRMREALRSFGPVTFTFGKTSLFTNPDADVLKIDIDSPDLRRLNKLISRLAPTHDTHPTYMPHATLAYLKPGRGRKYIDDKSLAGQSATVDSVVFSGKKGHRETLPLGPVAQVPYRARA